MDISRKAEGIVRLALSEDLGSEGDITTGAVCDEYITAVGRVIAREACVVCGQTIAETVFKLMDSRCSYEIFVGDGAQAEPGKEIGRARGPLQAILSGERTALNFLCHLSGIATLTRRLVGISEPFGIDIMDTRKTHPGMREVEKYAVVTGGGKNHRMGLFDGILIKDNHIAVAGGVRTAVGKARNKHGERAVIEVETKDLSQVSDALEAGADVIMLDNMDPDAIRKAVSKIAGRAKIEVSGGITPGNIRDYLIPGVNAISMGFITMSAPSVDIYLDLEPT